MLSWIKKSHGLLGMNARNLNYIRRLNPRGSILLANNKLRSKRALRRGEVPVPRTFGVIRNREELEQFDWQKLPVSFVLKPNRGLGGGGILVVFGSKGKERWVLGGGKILTLDDMKNHILDVFDGFYSMYGGEDVVFFEERIQISKALKPFSFRGIPDIRVIVYNQVPVMAMLRLSTQESGGKANLHMGGIGVGIDIATGVTTHAIMRDRLIEKTPDKHLGLSGIRIPYWKEILRIAIRAQKASELGYIGVDVAIDKDLGPMVLEINAHPGMAIQIANLAPLKYRLRKVRGLKIKSENHAIRVAQDLFGGEVEQEIEEISGKQILGIIEKVKVAYRGEEKKFMNLEAKVDTGADLSSLDRAKAVELGYGEVIRKFEATLADASDPNDKNFQQQLQKTLETYGQNYGFVMIKSSHGQSLRLLIKIKFILSGVEIVSPVSIIDRSNLQFPMIIGRKSMMKFLVDPSKNSQAKF